MTGTASAPESRRARRVDTHADTQADTAHHAARSTAAARAWRGKRGMAVLALLLALAFAVQGAGGAYTSELTTGADDPAHFVSALMIRDYLASGLAQSPLDFARDYYAHYPKVAIGNWPPVFHGILGAWMLVLPAAPESAYLLIALMAAVAAWGVARRFAPLVGAPLAFAGAALFLVLRPVPHFLASVMAEIPLTLFCAFAVLAWARFLDDRSARALAAFAALFVLAVMTKANGLLLLLVPPLSIVIGGRWRILRLALVWKTVAAALLLTLPWILWFLPTMRAGWASLDGLFGDAGTGASYYLRSLPRAAGWGVVALAAVGAWHRLGSRSAREAPGAALWASGAAMVAATFLFHAVAPAGREVRHLLPAYPFLAMLAAAGVVAVAVPLRRPLRSGTAATALAGGAALVLVLVEALPVRVPRLTGFGRAAASLAPAARSDSLVTLVASDAAGEGAFVAEMAIRDPARPRHVVWRATKLLATVTWAGRDYVERATSDAALLRVLELAHVDVVVLDRTVRAFPHQRSLERVVAAHPDRFVLRAELPVRRGGDPTVAGLAVYDFVPAAGAAPGVTLRQVPGYHGVEPDPDSLPGAGTR